MKSPYQQSSFGPLIPSLLVAGFAVLLVYLLSPPIAGLLIKCLFPVTAMLMIHYRRDNLMAPNLLFPVVYLIWLWIACLTFLPVADSVTMFDPIPDREWMFFLLGFMGYIGAVFVYARPHIRAETLLGLRPEWDTDRLLLLLMVVTLVTLFAWGVITRVEGIPLFQNDVSQSRVDIPDRHHIMYEIEMIGTNFMLPVLFLFKWTASYPKRFGYVLWALIFINFFILLSQGNRGAALPPAVTIFVMRHLIVKPWKTKQIAIYGAIGALAVGVSGYFRSLQSFGDSFIEDQIRLGVPPPLQPFASIYFFLRVPLSTFRNVMGLLPSTVGYQHGRLSLGAILQLLPGRHPSSDFFFKDLQHHAFVGFGEPASLLGTFYADFGVTGIFCEMFLIGLLTAWVYKTMIVNRSAQWVIIYAYLLQKLISSIYGSFFEYVIELLLPILWYISLRILIPQYFKFQPIRINPGVSHPPSQMRTAG